MVAWRRLATSVAALALTGCAGSGVIALPDEVSYLAPERDSYAYMSTTTTWYAGDGSESCTIWPTTTVWHADDRYPATTGPPTTWGPYETTTTWQPDYDYPVTTFAPTTTTILGWTPPLEEPPDYVPEPPDFDDWPNPPTTELPPYPPSTVWYPDEDAPYYPTTTWNSDSDYPSCTFASTTTMTTELPEIVVARSS